MFACIYFFPSSRPAGFHPVHQISSQRLLLSTKVFSPCISTILQHLLLYFLIYIYLFGSSGFSDHPSNCLRWPRLELEVEVMVNIEVSCLYCCALACVQQQREGFCFVVFYFVFSFEFEWRRTRLVWWMWNGSLLSFSPTSLIQPKWETNCILFAANHQ